MSLDKLYDYGPDFIPNTQFRKEDIADKNSQEYKEALNIVHLVNKYPDIRYEFLDGQISLQEALEKIEQRKKDTTVYSILRKSYDANNPFPVRLKKI